MARRRYVGVARPDVSSPNDAFDSRDPIRYTVLRAHRLAERRGAVSRLGGGGEVESAGERLGLRPTAVDSGGRDPGQAQPFGPKELVAGERCHDRRRAGARGGVGRPRPAVMDHHGGARKEPVVRRIADGQHIVGKALRIGAAPAGLEERAPAGQRRNQRIQGRALSKPVMLPKPT